MNPALGINGFGRIGRTSFRVWWNFHRDSLDLRMINTSGSMEIEEWAHLLRFDSNYGIFHEYLEVNRHQSKDDVTDENPVLGTFRIGGREIIVTAQRDPKKLPWGQHGVETVLESSGAFTSEEKAAQHFEGGAKKVLISAPGKGGDIKTAVLGVNAFNQEDKVRSNASCTTNCITPVIQVLSKHFGVEKAMFTTVHAYTDDQNIQDNSHRDLRRSRSAAKNIIPTSSGAAIATGEVVPEMNGIFDGYALRVPVSVGSISDIVAVVKRPTTVEEINQIFEQEAQTDRWRNIMAVTSEPLVSSDIVGRRESSIVDLGLTNVVGETLVKVVAWYDNEWGYCNRLVEQVYTP